MFEFLSHIHKRISRVAGDICWSLTLRKVTGGRRALANWATTLREIADDIEQFLASLDK
jgi:hypothetical protein